LEFRASITKTKKERLKGKGFIKGLIETEVLQSPGARRRLAIRTIFWVRVKKKNVLELVWGGNEVLSLGLLRGVGQGGGFKLPGGGV